MTPRKEFEMARRMAEAVGLRAEKTPGWFVLTNQRGEVVLGDRWQASAEDVIALCQEMRSC